MKKMSVAAVILLAAASVCSASGFELLRSITGDFNTYAPKPPEPAASSDNKAHVPFYNELPNVLSSDPVSTSNGVRIWLFSPLNSYKSSEDASAVMTFWKTAMEKSGIKVVSSMVTSTGGDFYEFEIRYAGDKYVSLYESLWKPYNTEEEANSALTAQVSLITQRGLPVITAMVAQYEGKYVLMVYYLVNYDPAAANRYQICDYHTGVLYATENAAIGQAQLDKNAFERAGIPVVDTAEISGPNGTLYLVYYIGKTAYPQLHSESNFETAEKANAAMTGFIRQIEQSNATVIETKVYPSGPWFQDRYSFDVRYIQKN